MRVFIGLTGGCGELSLVDQQSTKRVNTSIRVGHEVSDKGKSPKRELKNNDTKIREMS